MNTNSTRRSFLKNTALGMTAMISSRRAGGADAPARKRPNIFFAIADDWGWPHSSLYGDKVVKTPTFNRVAARGILFKHAFVTSPSCTPSRNSVLTGQYHWRLGPGANLWSSLPKEHKTYPNILEDKGYFVGSYRKSWGPGRSRKRPEAGTRYRSVKEFFAKRPKDKPFCFWFGSSDPHRGYKWQSGIKGGIKPADVQVPPCFPDSTEIRTDICDYYWAVQRFDRELSEALKIVEATGEMDNTIVVVTGDNGWPFPRGKANLYDLGIREPLAVQWDDKITKGRVVEDFVSFADFAPTFLEAAGIKPLDVMTGRSLMNVFESAKSGMVDSSRDYVLTGKERHTPAQGDNMDGTPMRAIRNRDFLYIHNFKPDYWPAGGPTSMHGTPYADVDGSPTKSYIVSRRDDPKVKPLFELSFGKRPADELYDLRKDPHQLKNVAGEAEYAGTLKKLKAQLMKELKETADPRVLGKGDAFDKHPYYGRMKKKI